MPAHPSRPLFFPLLLAFARAGLLALAASSAWAQAGQNREEAAALHGVPMPQT